MIDIQSFTGLTQDSRKVQPGFLFAAFPGETVDGRDYIEDAIAKGARAVLTDMSSCGLTAGSQDGQTDPAIKSQDDSIEYVYEDNPRRAFAHLCAAFYQAQPARIAAVTGTNGKTSVVHFTEQIWRALGYEAASLGTLSGRMTTLDPVGLHEELAALAGDGVTHLAMEASSHGLHQYRMDGARISAAGFTNLSRDHLDYHDTMKDYFAAKARLFTEVLDENGVAVINADVAEGQELIGLCEAAGRRVMTYGLEGRGLQILSIAPHAQGQTLELKINSETYRINLNLVGAFQISNALCALGLVLADESVDQEKAVAALESLKGAPGRLQHLDHPAGAAVYVDFAHTPDALSHVLKALRPHTDNQLICLFGCGGDRDHGKRPEMGRIASQFADQVIVTDDNPRSEDPASIRADILKGAPSATELGDRRDSIHTTIQTLTTGDVLLVAGKGHEQGQIFADRTDPFDDVTEVQTAIRNL